MDKENRILKGRLCSNLICTTLKEVRVNNIQFTSLFKNIREKYNQKIVISSGFPEIFEFSPHVAYSSIWSHNVFSMKLQVVLINMIIFF